MIVVGLILGTRMWYAMWDAESDEDAAFESSSTSAQGMRPVCRAHRV